MASSSRRTHPSLIDKLRTEPYQFDFFQAVRILRLLAARGAQAGTGTPHFDIGEDNAPQDEILRFRALISHAFPPTSIASMKWPALSGPEQSQSTSPVAMSVSFFGLTGPSGVLPQHYTQLLIDRVRQKDYSLRDFLDIFNHRLISLFYRAWEKYRVPIAYERARYAGAQQEDLLLECLYCLVGMGTGQLRARLEIPDEALLYFGGHFAHRPRNAVSLQHLLQDFFELPVMVEQFHGQWLYLRIADQTQMQTDAQPDGRNAQLGLSAVVGEKVWGVENSFRLRLGPLTYQQFLSFTPEGEQLVRICQLTRVYAGPDFDFEVQPVLLAAETPWCTVSCDDDAARLGWNTWLRGDEVFVDPDDAVFQRSGNPRTRFS